MKTIVFGAGGWGIALSMVAFEHGHDVTLWSFSEEEIASLRKHNENRQRLPGISLPDGIHLTNDLEPAREADYIILAVPSFAIRDTARRLRDYLRADTVIINAGKGLEDGSLKRFSEVLGEELPNNKNVVLSGPSHAEEVARRIFTSVTVSGADLEVAERVQKTFSLPRFRLYVNPDIIGVELGGALKNVIALAAGIVDGLDMGDNTKAALMTRGLAEIARLGIAVGARESTFAGLSGMGDLMVTCGSMHSRNRRAGILIGQGTPIEQTLARVGTVEGYWAARAAWELSCRYKVDMPLVRQCYRICYEGLDPHTAVKELFERPLCYEVEYSWIK
ncbi:MAG: NAD(P)-dependent glycerol-3-phosphate dehydrogenase [Clostridia bacterium]|nr:NAD(P)-dependent glycerol-3-phosphate dehydrogenase [Clostridia bacterium]